MPPSEEGGGCRQADEGREFYLIHDEVIQFIKKNLTKSKSFPPRARRGMPTASTFGRPKVAKTANWSGSLITRPQEHRGATGDERRRIYLILVGSPDSLLFGVNCTPLETPFYKVCLRHIGLLNSTLSVSPADCHLSLLRGRGNKLVRRAILHQLIKQSVVCTVPD